jgi:hypothetical protein
MSVAAEEIGALLVGNEQNEIGTFAHGTKSMTSPHRRVNPL